MYRPCDLDLWPMKVNVFYRQTGWKQYLATPSGERGNNYMCLLFEALWGPSMIRRCLYWGKQERHVIRDLPNIFNVNCDLHIYLYVKRDWGYTSVKHDQCHLLSAWSVIKAPICTWKLHKSPKFTYKRHIMYNNFHHEDDLLSVFIGWFPELSQTLTCRVHVLERMTTMYYCYYYAQSGIVRFGQYLFPYIRWIYS